MSEISRPLLRWAGSKKKLLPGLIEAAPAKYERYIEPFCGSISLFLKLEPERAVLSDINPELINFYRCLRLRPVKIAKIFHQMPCDEEFYYQIRGVHPKDLSKDDRAARFLYLNRFCFNGVYRTNKKGIFNVPRGTRTGAIPTIEEITSFGRFIRRADFKLCDFEGVSKEIGKGDFIYLDPPYAGRDVKDRGEYGLGSFNIRDLDRLCTTLRIADENGAKILLSYADLPEIRSRFSDWDIKAVPVARSISGFAKGRSVVNELFVKNY